MKEAKARAKDVQYFRKHQQKYYMKLGTKANKLQKHFLDPYTGKILSPNKTHICQKQVGCAQHFYLGMFVIDYICSGGRC